MRNPEKNGEMLREIWKEMSEREMPGLIYPIMHFSSEAHGCRHTDGLSLDASRFS